MSKAGGATGSKELETESDADPDSEPEVAPKPKPKKRERRTGRNYLLMIWNCVLCVTFVYTVTMIYRIINEKQPYSMYQSKSEHKGSKPMVKLPSYVKPIHYNVTIKPYLHNGRFDGSVNVSIDVQKTTKDLILHSKNLKIGKVSVFDGNATELNIESIDIDEYKEIMKITMKQGLVTGKYRAVIPFSGSMTTVGTRLTLTKFEHKGKQRLFATTNMGDTGARSIYPCFDQPTMKATFSFKIMKPKPKRFVVVSVMPEEGEPENMEIGDVIKFAKTNKMATCMTGFTISDLDNRQEKLMTPSGPITVRLFGNNIKLVDSFKLSFELLNFYLQYFNVNYTIPKLDILGLPELRLRRSTMHSGFITIKEDDLLIDHANTQSYDVQCATMLIAHELAHNWFGNYVSMKWWNDVWLYEGYVSYIEYKAMDSVKPDWGLMDQFLLESTQPAMYLDAEPNTNILDRKVETTGDLKRIYDPISYLKAAAIYRMLEHAATEPVFQKATTNFLTNNAFGNAGPREFINEVHELAKDDADIKSFMSTWTSQNGIPVLTATRIVGGYRLTQARFLLEPNTRASSVTNPFKYKWTIPITYTTDKSKEPSLVWFNHDDPYIDIYIPDAEWVKFNHHQIGYYRVNYEDIGDWMTLINNIRSLDISDRVNLIDDSFSLADAELISYLIPLELTKTMVDEYDYVPWHVATQHLIKLCQYLDGSNLSGHIKSFLANVINNAYAKFSWTDDSEYKHIDRLARYAVFYMACSIGHTRCLQESLATVNSWIDGEIPLSVELRKLMFHCDLDSAVRERIWAKFVSENGPEIVNLTLYETVIQYFQLLLQFMYSFFQKVGVYEINSSGLNTGFDMIKMPYIDEHLHTQMMDKFLKQFPEIGCQMTGNKETEEMKMKEDEEKNKKKPDPAQIKWLKKHELLIEAFLKDNLF
ncbi:PREDICTED: glutamyl aminopeptidase-like isoform X2 [Nicrophorus vespilloides]|nr:PREDICTED: glutamyl aminopeptidase-like isoform X2 [Nicrophorus vespilloides]